MNRSPFRVFVVFGLVCVVLVLMSARSLTAQEGFPPAPTADSFQYGSLLIQGTDLEQQELDRLIEVANSIIGTVEPLVPAAGYRPFALETIRSAEGWALLNFASYPNTSEQAESVHLVTPTLVLGVAQQRPDGTWGTAVEPQEAFYQWISFVPENILSPTSKSIILSVQGLSPLPAAPTAVSVPGLPYPAEQAWRYNDGPHLSWKTNSSLDFGTPTQGVSARVHAADTGIVINKPNDTCLALRRGGDGLIIWYQHIDKADIDDFKLDETVSLGQSIGMTTKTLGCGAVRNTGHHVHITWQLQNNQPYDPEGSSFNGWVVRGENLHKGGTVVKPDMIQKVLYHRDPVTKWRGEYFNNENYAGNPVLVRDDPNINFEWFSNSPGLGVNAEHFSVRWTRNMNFVGGNYEFTVSRDDGARLFIDGRKVFDKWGRGVVTHTFQLNVARGRHDIQFEMHEIDGWATAKLGWTLITGSGGNLALNRPSYATSEAARFNSELANDGSGRTRWTSTSARWGEWWMVDLGSVKPFSQIKINWQANYAINYAIRWSNGPNCADVYSYTTGNLYGVNSAGWVTHEVGNRSARCVAIELMTPRAGRTNYSFWEFEVYNAGAPPLSPLPGVVEEGVVPIPTAQP